jgi:glycosyltransferase involved in cell wall biosynthesis
VWWATVELPRLAGRVGADVIHHPLPAISPVARAAQVVTVADLAFERLPHHFDRGFRTYAHLAHRAAARAAAAVICVSETTAADARSAWGVSGERIVVAPHGPGQDVGGPERERVHLLYVGDAEPRKNLAGLLEAYRLYRERVPDPLPLLLAGSASASGAGITVVNRPSPQRLAELYRAAVALLHPSLYEGFGLTALEAMSAGTPVIAADSPGVREVCAQAARYVDPRDPPSLAAAITELAAAPALRHELAARGRARARTFSWACCARAHVDAYSLALARA